MIQSANMYLYFQGNTEEAFTLYRSVFGGDFSAVVRFRDFPDNPMQIPEQELDKIAHIALPLGEAKVLQRRIRARRSRRVNSRRPRSTVSSTSWARKSRA